jgi:endonuclease/exonuclease/phosphatase family metal-dependent hydrolase
MERKPLSTKVAKKLDLIMATWNVRTMLQAGRMQEIRNEMIAYKIDIMALQEIRWQGQGRIDKPDYTLLYSGSVKKTGQLGTGFMMSTAVKKCLLEFEPQSNRICKIRLKGKFRNVTLISAHAPTNEKDDQEKESFYEDLEEVYNRIPRYDMVIIMGDFNAKIGKQEYQQQVTGPYSIHDINNENGNMLTQFATRNKLMVKSTMFPHKHIHLGTWKIPGTNEVNQIDHVLVTSRHSSSVIDIRSCRGPNCDSDHYLVKIKVRERIANAQTVPRRKTRRWEVEKLNKDTVRREKYQQALKSNLKPAREEGEGSVQKTWEQLEMAIKAAAGETLGEVKNRRNVEWFDEECAAYISEKNRARQKMIHKETRSNYEEYREWRRKTNRLCKRKKRENMMKQMEEINLLNQQNERRKFYKAVNNMKKGFQPRMNGCKGKDGKMIGEEKEILERWTEHFKELLKEGEENDNEQENHKENHTPKIKPDCTKELIQEICNEPTKAEVERTIQRMKNNRAPGEDTIVAELIKYGGDGLVDAVYELMKLIWTTENMPQEWDIGIICPIYKKGDKLECNNYRGITLLNNMYKIFSSILNGRMKTATEKIIGEYQCGFRQNKSTTDQLFILRQMIERHNEHGLELHMLFMDFKQAFDSIKRGKLFMAMDSMGIPQKLIRLTKMTMRQTKARVKIDNQLGVPFEYDKGVKQGDSLSTTLFILALHNAVQEIDQRGTIYTKSSQICAYADDVVVVTRSETKIRQVYKEIERRTQEMGLMVNEKKTKYMMISTRQKQRQIQNLKVGDKTFEGVSKFRYLGNVIDREGRISECIKDRIQAGNKAYAANYHMLKSKIIKRAVKIQIYKTMIRPVATYGSETWTLAKSDENRLKIFERKILRKIYGPVYEGDTWRIRYNEELNRLTKGKDIVKFIKAQRIRWLGHVKRMEEGAMPRKTMEGRLYIGRRKGRPRLRWMDDVVEDLKTMKIRQWTEKVKSREQWRQIVKEAKAHPGL